LSVTCRRSRADALNALHSCASLTFDKDFMEW
jgi:hypothetical protein